MPAPPRTPPKPRTPTPRPKHVPGHIQSKALGRPPISFGGFAPEPPPEPALSMHKDSPLNLHRYGRDAVAASRESEPDQLYECPRCHSVNVRHFDPDTKRLGGWAKCECGLRYDFYRASEF